jgi:hypothetical protein
MSLLNLSSRWSDYLQRHGNDASLTFDADGTLSLLADRHRVDCQIAPEFLILRARICGMPADRSGRHPWLSRILMLSNAHAHNRQEFPVLTSQGTLQLHTWIDIRAGFQEFGHAFDQFLEALDAWRHALMPRAGTISQRLSRLGGTPFGNSVSSAGEDANANAGNALFDIARGKS